MKRLLGLGSRAAVRIAVCLAATLAVAAPGVATQGASARQLVLSGQYETAMEVLEDRVREAPTDADGRLLLARALRETGKYPEALDILEAGPAAISDHLANARGEILYALGRLEEARAAWTRSMEAGAPQRHVARLNLAILEYDYGDRDRALQEFDSFIDLYNNAVELPARDLIAVGVALRYLAVTNADLRQDALMAFDRASEQAPDDPEPLLQSAELFLEGYSSTDAYDDLGRAESLNSRLARTVLVRARAMEFDGAPGVLEMVDGALELNPDLVAARVFKSRQHMATENYDAALEEIERALEINPVSLGALTARAAVHFMRGEQTDFERVRDRVRELAPEYPGIYTDLAELSARTRMYAEAAEFARTAIEIDSRSWEGYQHLGMNLLRLGRIEEGKAALETTYENDPTNVWVHNTLILIDSFRDFREVDSGNFVFVLHEEEADLLLPYVEGIAQEAFEAMRKRYGLTPPLPIRIEVYPDHGDFSVRTVGLSGIGALGVAFGSVIAMDSPTARPLGEFNWASVLWHEMAHVFHLALSEHQVPRWFSEGLAVHEQRAGRPGWGHQPNPGFLSRYNEGLMPPASRLNSGFVRPSYPEQVVDSYFLASQVFAYIEGRWGFDAVVGMLEGFREGETTQEQFESRLGTDPEDFDADFAHWFEGRYERALAAVDSVNASPMGMPDSGAMVVAQNPNNFVVRLRAGVAAFQEGDLDGAEEHFRAALRLFPEYGGNDSPYWYLAQIHEQRGEMQLAAQALARLNGLTERHYTARLKQAEILTALGDMQGAADALEAAVWIHPYDFEVHERLAERQMELERFEGAVRERRAILALDPVDRADAWYRLALAQQAAGELGDARRSVLSALEIAPSFDAALELLLELRGGTGAGVRR